MKFVKAGDRLPKTSKQTNCGLLHNASDGVLFFDLTSTLIILPAITIHNLDQIFSSTQQPQKQ